MKGQKKHVQNHHILHGISIQMIRKLDVTYRDVLPHFLDQCTTLILPCSTNRNSLLGKGREDKSLV